MSTYSPNLAIQLIATNDQAGQWGLTTNVNLGTLLESAISGYVTQAFADANVVISMPLGADGGNGSVANPVAARNMFITCSGTNTAQRSLFVPTNTKLYFISNQTTGGFGINVTTVGGSGIVIPNGQTALLVCDGVNIKNAINFFPSLSAPVVINTPSSAVNTLTVNGISSNANIVLAGGSGIVAAIATPNNYGIQVTPTVTSQVPGLLVTNSSSGRQLEFLYAGSTSGGVYGASVNTSVINAQNGLTLSVGDSAALQISGSRNIVIPPPVSGLALYVTGSGGPAVIIDSVAATSSGLTWRRASLSIGDIGSGDFIVSGGSAGDFGLTSRAGSLILGSNSTGRVAIGQNGTTTFNTPSSGSTVVIGNAVSGPSLTVGIGQAGTESIFVTGSVNTFGMVIASSSSQLLGTQFQTAVKLYHFIIGNSIGNAFSIADSGVDRLQLGSGGGWTFPVPPTGVSTVVINGFANQYTTQILSNNTAGTSFGLFIGAGSNASDIALQILNGAQNSQYFRVMGDGGVIVGTPGSNKGLGSINSVKSYINSDQIYSGVPPSSSTTISRADVNMCVVATGNIKVPNAVFNEGDCVSVYNDTGSNITLQGVDTVSGGISTMRLAGTGLASSRTLAQRGMATIWFRSGTECIVSGAGTT